MAGIIIYVSATVLPGNKKIFETTLTDIVSKARQAPGCLKYQWFVNPDNNSNYIIYGEFDSKENFALYQKSEVVSMIGKQLIPLLKDKPSFKHFLAENFEQG